MGYRAYPEYKEARLEWLGNLPKHWECLRLRLISKRYSGGTPDKKNDLYWLDGTIPWLNSGAVNQGVISQPTDFISELALKESSAKWIPAGAVIIALAGQGKTKGTTAITKFKTTCNQSMAAIVFENDHPKYMYWWLHSQYKNIRGMASDDGRDGLNLEMIGSIPCPRPAENEQLKIAQFLDYKTALIDRLIEKKQELIEKLQEQRVTVITQAVTKGLNSGVALKDSGIEWLGDVPAHWDVWRLRFSVTMSGGMTPSTTAPQYWEGPIPWATPKDMKSDRITSSIDTLTELALKETSLQLYTPRQVLIVVRGMILAHTFPVGVNDVDVTVNQDMKVLSTTLNSEYLAILLRGFQSVVLSIVEEAAHGTKVLRTDLFKNIQLPVPPSHEQEAIVANIHNVTAKSDSRIEAVNTAITRLQEYRTALITAAVTGQIDVRDWQAPESSEQSAQDKDVA
jgi:type I restriction enzyme S subunit